MIPFKLTLNNVVGVILVVIGVLIGLALIVFPRLTYHYLEMIPKRTTASLAVNLPEVISVKLISSNDKGGRDISWFTAQLSSDKMNNYLGIYDVLGATEYTMGGNDEPAFGYSNSNFNSDGIEMPNGFYLLRTSLSDGGGYMLLMGLSNGFTPWVTTSHIHTDSCKCPTRAFKQLSKFQARTAK